MIAALVLIDAIASTASSHHPGCACDVCAAASGDQEALERLLLSIQVAARTDGGDTTGIEDRCTL